jgi:hypothetical protein
MSLTFTPRLGFVNNVNGDYVDSVEAKQVLCKTLDVDGDITNDGSLTVTGSTTLGDNPTGDVLTVNAVASFNGNTTIGSDGVDTLTVNAVTTFVNAASFNGNITLGNAATDTITTTKGTVTQATNITTGVTLNATNGRITTQAATAAAGASQTFTVSNNLVSAGSVILLTIQDYAGTFTTNGIPIVNVDNVVADTSFDIVVSNGHSANALNGALIIGFLVLKS